MTEVGTGDEIRAEDHNALVRGLAGITYVEGQKPTGVIPYPHPWKTRVQAGDEPGSWRVRMLAGYVNDVEATVAYLQTGDQRGWKMPDDFPASRRIGEICERSWREQGEQAPVLMLHTKSDFIPVGDDARPSAFRTEEAWKKELLVASVYVYARPLGVFMARVLPARYRTWAGKLPRAAYPHGVRELAKVYVLRGEDERDQLAFVKQEEFWDLAAEPVDPIKLLPDYVPYPGGSMGGIGLGFGDAALAGFNIVADSVTKQVNAALENIAAATASVEFWSV